MSSELARAHMASTWHRSYKTWAHLWSCLLWNPIDFSQAFGQQSKALYVNKFVKITLWPQRLFGIEFEFLQFSRYFPNVSQKSKWKNMSWNSKAEFAKEGIFFALQLFAWWILSMKKLEIKRTKPTFIISVLKVQY